MTDPFHRHVDQALDDSHTHARLVLGPIHPATAALVFTRTGLDISAFERVVDSDDIRHIFRRHGDPVREARRQPPQQAITVADLKRMRDIVRQAHAVLLVGEALRRKPQRLIYTAIFEGHAYCYCEQVIPGKRIVSAKTMWKQVPEPRG